MNVWQSLFQPPADLAHTADAWFVKIARTLLLETTLLVGNQPHRFAEIEFYYHGTGHLDVFTHRDALQRECGRWYFHKVGGVYKAGSFKGMDLTFGDGTAHAGILIRSIVKPDGSVLDGPSLCVDYLLDANAADKPATLDKVIAQRPAWELGNPLQIVPAVAPLDRPVVRSARIGLTLKKLKQSAAPPQFVVRPYRFLSEPRLIAKGRQHVILQALLTGQSVAEIAALTGSSASTIQRYATDLQAGQTAADLAPFWGIDLSPKDLSALHGVIATLAERGSLGTLP